jgi:hypothetical protein
MNFGLNMVSDPKWLKAVIAKYKAAESSGQKWTKIRF